jgi:uncharacterized protein (TIGR02246 family)
VFERFTDEARRGLVLSEAEARGLRHNFVGTEHLLLGLIRVSQGVAAAVLASLGISFEIVREQVVEIVGEGQLEPVGSIPFTPRAKKVLELSLREAQQMGHTAIGTEHILLALVRESEGVGAQVLSAMGVSPDRVRQCVTEVLAEGMVETAGRPGRRSSEPVERVVVRQMLAYNAHDAEGVAACYARDARILDGGGTVIAAGREAIRARYAALFAGSPTVRAISVDRMTVEPYVVEHELAGGVAAAEAVVEALVLYKIVESQIVEARFLS